MEKASEYLTTLEQEPIAIHVYMYLNLRVCVFRYVCTGGKLKDLFHRSVLKAESFFSEMLLQLPQDVYVSLFYANSGCFKQ